MPLSIFQTSVLLFAPARATSLQNSMEAEIKEGTYWYFLEADISLKALCPKTLLRLVNVIKILS